jgi:antitoxin (DNA-binding transcriptional repressor) of toxin-antitoxin stability system
MTRVKVAYALQNFQELLARVAMGESVMICRYNTPVAVLSAPPKDSQPARRFGTLKGKAAIVDPNCFAPMSDADADAWINGKL